MKDTVDLEQFRRILETMLSVVSELEHYRLEREDYNKQALAYFKDFPDMVDRVNPGDDLIDAIIEDARRLRKAVQS